MRNKYEELPMIEEIMTESETVNNETNNKNNNNNNNSSGVIKESTTSTAEPSASTEETEELVTVKSAPESLGDMLGTKVGADEDKMDEEDDDDQQGEEDEDLKSKYVKLIEHNSRLVDLLKTTMQIQTDMFRKLIHYVFP